MPKITKELEIFARDNNIKVNELEGAHALLCIALQKAISVYNFASMTPYERNTCRNDMRFCQQVSELYDGVIIDEDGILDCLE